MIDLASPVRTDLPPQWAKVIDHSRCIGCHACSTACKSENEVPLSVNRTHVKYVDVGVFPDARRAYQVTRCNQCEDPPCVEACPTTAMHRRPDGIVDFDKSICIGCKACIAACPYDAIFINPDDHSAEKCNFCAHRLDIGLEPACVVVCPTQAILVGDMHDGTSAVSRLINRDTVTVRRPEKATRPKLFYRDAHQVTLDPIAAKRPEGGLFMWSEQLESSHHVVSGHPNPGTSSASALLSYDVPHSAPWDWRVSLYTWTKGVAAGAYLVPAVLVLLGWIGPDAPLWRFVSPIVGGVFLAVTGVVLLWDLEHPARFYLIFTRSQWRSWLVRGAYIISGYAAMLAAHFFGAVTGTTAFNQWLMIAGIPLAAMTAVYTAYLFAQARARDLWQNTLLPPHLLVQAVLAGSASLLLIGAGTDGDVGPALVLTLATASALHVLFVLGEVTMGHPTAHARLATHEMTWGRHRWYFRIGLVLVAVGVATPWVGVMVAAPLALLGLLSHEHAYVQAGQSVPLA